MIIQALVTVLFKYFAKTTLKSSSPSLTLTESINKGLSALEVVDFNNTEIDKISRMKKKVSEDVRYNFESKYNKWKETWKNPEISKQSNPRAYAMSNEYKELIEFCQLYGTEIWGLVFDKFIEGDYMVRNAIEDLTFPIYQNLVDSVRQENIEQKQLKSGAVLVHTSKGNWNKYIKRILNRTDSNLQYVNKMTGVEANNNDFYKPLVIYPNPVSDQLNVKIGLKEKSFITVSICDISGRLIEYLATNEPVEKGWHNFEYNVSALKNGIYILKYQIDNDAIFIEKFQVFN